MLRQFSAKRIASFFALDLLGTLAMLLLAAYIRAGLQGLPALIVALWQGFHLPITSDWSGIGSATSHLPIEVLLLVTLIWPFYFIIFPVYNGHRNETLGVELLNVFFAITVSTLTLAGALFLTYRETSRALFLIFFLLDLILLLGGRVAWWLYRQRYRGRHKKHGRNILIVGSGNVGKIVAEKLEKHVTRNFNVVGFVDDDPQKHNQIIADLPVVGSLDRLPTIVAKYKIDDAVIALPLDAHPRLIETCRHLRKSGVHVFVVPDIFVLSFPQASLAGFSGIPLIDLGRPGIHGMRRQVKRVFDIVAVTFGLLFFAPLFCLVAILIKLDSPGPILYRQVRVGENGRRFTMFKFRSMKAGSNTEVHRSHITRLIRDNVSPDKLSNNGNTLKLKNDPRITRVGHIIRNTSLDELPQLFNVLRGDMSLVGPRPPLPYEVDLYQEWHMRRLEVPPGITGPWQVKARNRVSFDEMVRMDLAYIEQQSFLLDLSLIMQTPWVLIRGKGAG